VIIRVAATVSPEDAMAPVFTRWAQSCRERSNSVLMCNALEMSMLPSLRGGV
jgi:hypothetical protein